MDKPYRRGFFGLGAQFNAYEGPSKTTYHGQDIVSGEPTDVKQKTPTGGNHLQAENAQKKQNRQGYTVLTEESMGPLKRWLEEHPSQ